MVISIALLMPAVNRLRARGAAFTYQGA
jgi:hypothetical protein